jgi:hypothetical protein
VAYYLDGTNDASLNSTTLITRWLHHHGAEPIDLPKRRRAPVCGQRHRDSGRDITEGVHGQRTISLWFRVDDPYIRTRKQVLYEEGDATRGLNLYLYNKRLYAGGWNLPTSGGESGWAGTFISTDQWESPQVGGEGQWHHVALVLSGTATVADDALTLYVDGRLIDSGAGSQLWGHGGDIASAGPAARLVERDALP